MTNAPSQARMSGEPHRPASFGWFCALLLVLLAFFISVSIASANFLFLSADDRTGPGPNMQVLSLQIGQAARATIGGDAAAYDVLEQTVHRFGEAVEALRLTGNATAREPLARLASEWGSVDSAAQSILRSRQSVGEFNESARRIGAAVPELQAKLDHAVRSMEESGATSTQTYIAVRQIVLADRMLRYLMEVAHGGGGSVTAADRFARDTTMFGQVLTALRDGNVKQGIDKVEDAEARTALAEAAALYVDVEKEVDDVLDVLIVVLEAQDAADEIAAASTGLLESARRVDDALSSRSPGSSWIAWVSTMAATFLSLLLLIAALCIWPLRKGNR